MIMIENWNNHLLLYYRKTMLRDFMAYGSCVAKVTTLGYISYVPIYLYHVNNIESDCR